jgi:C1A family cysteine protease
MPEYPKSVSLRKYIDCIQPQENIGCCTASATLLAAEMIMSSAGQHINFSRLYLYYMTRKTQGRVGQKGAELKATLNALMTYGASPERFWPFTYNRMDIEPHSQAIQEAVHFKAQSYEEILSSDFKEYLTLEIPIIIGIRTGHLFWKIRGPMEEQRYKQVNNTDNRQSTGHAVTIIGYDDALLGGSWIIANSLGPKWGFQGYAALPYPCSADIGESYAITKFAGITAGKKISEN